MEVIFSPCLNVPKLLSEPAVLCEQRPALEGRCVEQSGASVWLRAPSPARREVAEIPATVIPKDRPPPATFFGRRPQVGLVLSGLSPFWLLPICSPHPLFTVHSIHHPAPAKQ